MIQRGTMSKIPRGQAVLAFVTLVSVISVDGKNIIKSICHHCDCDKSNADTFINDAWVDHLKMHTMKTVTGMSDSTCVHAHIIRTHVGSDDKIHQLIVEDIAETAPADQELGADSIFSFSFSFSLSLCLAFIRSLFLSLSFFFLNIYSA